MTKHAAGAFGSAIIIDDPLSDRDHDDFRAASARLLAGLTYDALVNPGVAYGSRGDEQGGSKGLHTPRPASRGTTFLDVVEIPPDEEVLWDNPEVHYAFLKETISALKQAGALDQASLEVAELAAQKFGAFGARFSAQKPG